MKRDSLQRVIARIGDLPAMPEVVAEVLRMTDDPSAALADVSERIGHDPALTAKILRVANSAYYGMKQYVGTLKLALVILGVREVRNIVLGVSVFETLRDSRTELLFAQDFVAHSITVAALSRRLGSHMHLDLHGEDFVCGLLHDIGKLVLGRYSPEKYAAIHRAARRHKDLCALELEEFGFSHADAAGALAVYWDLPQTLADSLWHHHPIPEHGLEQAKDPFLAALVRVANLTAHDDFIKDDPANLTCCNEEEAWAVLNRAPVRISPNTRPKTLAGFVRELKDSPVPLF